MTFEDDVARRAREMADVAHSEAEALRENEVKMAASLKCALAEAKEELTAAARLLSSRGIESDFLFASAMTVAISGKTYKVPEGEAAHGWWLRPGFLLPSGRLMAINIGRTPVAGARPGNPFAPAARAVRRAERQAPYSVGAGTSESGYTFIYGADDFEFELNHEGRLSWTFEERIGSGYGTDFKVHTVIVSEWLRDAVASRLNGVG